VWWEPGYGTSRPSIYVEKRAIVAWQILSDGAFPRLAGTDMHEGNTVVLILHPAGHALGASAKCLGCLSSASTNCSTRPEHQRRSAAGC
jgi:hypothetical protein